MIRQYDPCSPFTYAQTPRGQMRVGTVPIGSIRTIRETGQRVIVLAWIPRDYCKWDRAAGRAQHVRIRGGHIALVRYLSGGKPFQLSDAWLMDRY